MSDGTETAAPAKAKKKSKPKAKKAAKRSTVKPKAKSAGRRKPVKWSAARAARMDVRLSKAQKAKIAAVAKRKGQTVTTVVLDAINRIR